MMKCPVRTAMMTSRAIVPDTESETVRETEEEVADHPPITATEIGTIDTRTAGLDARMSEGSVDLVPILVAVRAQTETAVERNLTVNQ